MKSPSGKVKFFDAEGGTNRLLLFFLFQHKV